MRRRLSLSRWFSALIVALALLVVSGGAFQEVPEYGPAKGTLVIVGGGATDGTGIIEKFIELAGGADKKFVIVPTAGGNRNDDGEPSAPTTRTRIIASWLKRGLKNVKMLHTHDPKVADTEEFVKDLRDADAVWFNGGRQWNIVDSYANTLTYREFHKVLERGGVIGGSSAGATIQGEYLVRGDTSGPNVMMTAGAEPPEGVRVPAQVRDRSAHQRAQPLGRPDSGHQEVSRSCSASASPKAPRSSSRATRSR